MGTLCVGERNLCVCGDLVRMREDLVRACEDLVRV